MISITFTPAGPHLTFTIRGKGGAMLAQGKALPEEADELARMVACLAASSVRHAMCLHCTGQGTLTSGVHDTDCPMLARAVPEASQPAITECPFCAFGTEHNGAKIDTHARECPMTSRPAVAAEDDRCPWCPKTLAEHHADSNYCNPYGDARVADLPDVEAPRAPLDLGPVLSDGTENER